MAGHGLTANLSYIGKYHAVEFGLVLSIMSVMPEAMYQQGIDRQWLRRTNWDFFNPSFVNLSEQAIERAEIFASAVEAENRTIFGYQGMYDEMRVKRNMVCSRCATPSTTGTWADSSQAHRCSISPSSSATRINASSRIRPIRA